MLLHGLNEDNFNILIDTREIDELEWLKIRKKGIGGSEAAGILGLSKYSSPLTIYMDKMSEAKIQKRNEYTEWGLELEPIIKRKFAERYHKEVYDFSYTVQSKKNPFMLANIDGLVREDDGTLSLLEVKTATILQSDKWDGDEVPDNYYCQVQHYMHVLGIKKAYLVCLLGKTLIRKEIPYNEDFCKQLEEAERSFWEGYIEKQIMPAPSGIEEEEKTIYEMFPDYTGDEIEMPIEVDELVEEYLHAKEEQKIIDQRMKAIKAELKMAIGNNKRCVSERHKITWSPYQYSSFDTKRFKELYPELYNQFITTKESRKLFIK